MLKLFALPGCSVITFLSPLPDTVWLLEKQQIRWKEHRRRRTAVPSGSGRFCACQPTLNSSSARRSVPKESLGHILNPCRIWLWTRHLLYGCHVQRMMEKFSVGFWPLRSNWKTCLLAWILKFSSYPVLAFVSDQLMKRSEAATGIINFRVLSECSEPRVENWQNIFIALKAVQFSWLLHNLGCGDIRIDDTQFCTWMEDRV